MGRCWQSVFQLAFSKDLALSIVAFRVWQFCYETNSGRRCMKTVLKPVQTNGKLRSLVGYF